MERRTRGRLSEFWTSSDMSDLVGPYYVNPAQLRMLKSIIGSEEADAMRIITSAVQTGKINYSCPPISHPDWTESAIDPTTGKLICRPPAKLRLKPNDYDSRSCPEPGGDPLAIEKYIDYLGNTVCRRPVLRGHQSCPPPFDRSKVHHIVTKTGEGLCVADPYPMQPQSYMVFPFNINKKTRDMLESLNISYGDIMIDHLIRMNKYLNTYDDPVGLKTALHEDPITNIFKKFIGLIRTKDDIHIANIALRMMYRAKFPQKKMTIHEWFEWYNLPGSARIGSRKIGDYM